MRHLRGGGGQFPLKTVEFKNTQYHGAGNAYYLNAKDLIDAGIEFSTTSQYVLVTALLKKDGALVGTLTAPFVYSLSSSGYYNIQCPSNGSATVVLSGGWNTSNSYSNGSNTNAASCTASYTISIPNFDEQDCTISYYLTEA